MAYIGVSPSNGVRRKHTYTATAAQTDFTGAGAEGITLRYLDSNYIDVYQNGVKLSEADYTSTSGDTIVLAETTVSDIIEVVVYDVFSVADTVSKSAGGTFDGNITAAGTLAVTGNTTVGGTLGVTGAVTANAGVVVDNITIDGTTIALSTGDLTLDVAADIKLDAAGGDIKFLAGGTEFGEFRNIGSDLVLISSINDKDIVFKGQDNSSEITALTLDMSAAGDATFNSNLSAPGIISSSVGKSHIGEFTGSAAIAANSAGIIRLQDCFSSAYSVYRLIGEVGGDMSAQATGVFRFLTSGTTSHDSGYYWANKGLDDSGSEELAANANQAQFQYTKNLATTVSVHIDMHIQFGGIFSRIGILGRCIYHDQGSDRGFMDFGGTSEGITSATGIEFFTGDSGNMGGFNFSVYGFRTQQEATGKMVGSYS